MSHEHGRVLDVQTITYGSELTADTAAGATTLTVADAGDFDHRRGGWLSINDQVIAYTAADDDTGAVTLAVALAADAEEGDRVFLYDPLYQVISSDKIAYVAVDGDHDDEDPVEALVANHLVDKLDDGIRGEIGESVLLDLDGSAWRVIDVRGLGDADGTTGGGLGMQAEADDFHVVSASDVIADVAVVQLSHRPITESLKFTWGTLAQDPTLWTIDYDDRTVTFPLDGMVPESDRLWAHYWYRTAPETPALTGYLEFVGSSTAPGYTATYPTGVEDGDLLVLAFSSFVNNGGVITSPVSALDSRFTLIHSFNAGTHFVAYAVANGDTSDITLTSSGAGGSLVVAAYRGVTYAGVNSVSAFPSDDPLPQLSGVRNSIAAIMTGGSFAGAGSAAPPAGWTQDVIHTGINQQASLSSFAPLTASDTPAGSITEGNVVGCSVVIEVI